MILITCIISIFPSPYGEKDILLLVRRRFYLYSYVCVCISQNFNIFFINLSKLYKFLFACFIVNHRFYFHLVNILLILFTIFLGHDSIKVWQKPLQVHLISMLEKSFDFPTVLVPREFWFGNFQQFFHHNFRLKSGISSSDLSEYIIKNI